MHVNFKLQPSALFQAAPLVFICFIRHLMSWSSETFTRETDAVCMSRLWKSHLPDFHFSIVSADWLAWGRLVPLAS